MPIDIEEALREGYESTKATTGLVFVGVLFVLNAVTGLVTREAVYAPPVGPVPLSSPLQSPGPLDALAALALFALVLVSAAVSLVVLLAEVRTFVAGERERVREEFATRNAPFAVVNLFVGSVVFAVAVAVGLLLLVVPGVVLLVSLPFWVVFVAVDDASFVEGFRRSWDLVEGHRWSLFALGVVVVVAVSLVDAAFAGVGALAGGPYRVVVVAAGDALTSVFTVAVLVAAYRQLRERGAVASTADGADGDGRGAEADRANEAGRTTGAGRTTEDGRALAYGSGTDGESGETPDDEDGESRP